MRLLALLLISASVFGQKNYPKDFGAPLDIPMQLAGNFGELRPNHFHAGFDFKTNQREGLNVYAVGDGYVSRIKISTYGYGKAIYITHPNGFTTVYGHLQKAMGAIEAKIKETQYKESSYEVELFLKPNELPVKKGEIIGLSGNTGGSQGPHLHFEFRDSATEKAINPQFFGYDQLIKDTKKPIVSTLVAYPLDAESIVNKSKRPINLNLSLQSDGTYISEKVLATGKIGFGINAYDLDDVSYNSNGTYKGELLTNGKPIFEYRFDEMAFDEGRYINAFIDYTRYKKTKSRIQKLFMKQPYALTNIYEKVNNGVLDVVPNYAQTNQIEVSDFNGNKTIIRIPVEYSNQKSIVEPDVVITPYLVKNGRDFIFEKDNYTVTFPEGTFYDDFYLNFDVKNDVLFLHQDDIGIHKAFTISYDAKDVPENQREKSFIASTNGTKWSYITTKRNGTTFTASTKTLGQFKLLKDFVAPKISSAKSIEGKWISAQKLLVFTISDDLSGIKSYNGYLNGKWMLFEYESKLNRLTHQFEDGIVAEGENKLKLIVTDNVGNSTTFETTFFRSQKQ
ncbi:M23 family metallopeptidase [Flavobacterium sp.]|uniref:M23 family metallopeptidase n=1 Tax=Flavobacterium sp. TaxID=239 RepID=UPI002B4AF520|nr:M23 family metallopeptidase [Flavobacterium sp.]HLP65370.1 M23 family metallopeptidase [Flavobacterium sp.]